MRKHTGEKPYTCDVCGRGFSQKYNMKSHIQNSPRLQMQLLRKNHETEGVDGCSRTSASAHAEPFEQNVNHLFSVNTLSLNILVPGSLEVNKPKFVYKQSFSEKQILSFVVRTPDGMYMCCLCQKVMKKQSDILRHIRVHTGEKPYKCEVCDKRFRQKTHVNSHMIMHLNTQNQESLQTVLDLHDCVISFCYHLFSLFLSVKMKLKVFLLTSVFLPFSARSPNGLLCGICGKEFKRRFDMSRHMRSHTGEKPFKCEICHRVRSPDGIFKCCICGKENKWRSDMDRHMRVHTGEKPFTCPVCQRGFKLKSHLKSHGLTHLKSEMFTSTGCIRSPDGLFWCKSCGKEYKWRSDMARHVRIHTGEKPFKCSVCQKAFALKSNLKSHMFTHFVARPGHFSTFSVGNGTYARHAIQ
ncbi:ZN888-like protein [Mya arenaria]|uniref:ZN888-like protein n=1 Tax=Mya arenaria TaxID=6604 RepID=A0ABY7F9U7_MYAAR|nr:ZN888-like protein [Mya arenaria]